MIFNRSWSGGKEDAKQVMGQGIGMRDSLRQFSRTIPSNIYCNSFCAAPVNDTASMMQGFVDTETWNEGEMIKCAVIIAVLPIPLG